MTQLVRLSNKLYDIDSDELQRAIEATPDIRATRPVCACRPEALEMYVAKVNGRFVIKRMPNTAHLHDPTCESYEAPQAVSGAGDVDGKAILHDDEANTITLKLAFSLSKNNSSHVATQAPTPPDTAKASVSRLTLRATMDYLWDQAQLNRWRPQMAGKRNYGVAYKYVRRAVDHTHAKRLAMSEMLYMPEPFYAAEAEAIKERSDRALVRCAYQRSGKQQLMLLFGEVKQFNEARQGARVQIKHAPFLDFYLPPALNDKMQKLFDAELALWNADADSHLMMLGTFARNSAGMYEISEVALMVVDKGWIPVRSLFDLQLFQRLAGEGRAFLKGLRFNADPLTRFADVLLTDTVRPTAVYVVAGTEPSEEIEQLGYECEEAGLDAFFLRGTDVTSAELPRPRESGR